MIKEDSSQIKLDKLEAVIARGTEDVAGVASLLSELLSIPSDDRYATSDLSPKRRREKTLEALINQVIEIYPDTTDFKGKQVPCLRIRGVTADLVAEQQPFLDAWG